MPRLFLGWIVLAALAGASGVVRAQGGTADGNNPALKTPGERQRLRAELDRLNAEIDTLKRDNRSLRDDYLLRSRMADAEALARRLTALDARLPPPAPSDQRSTPAAWAAPEASPSDDRAELEAKADILADQARRLNGQADSLATRLADLRARNELRRRAGQLERDPFSAMEQAKRRLAATGTMPLPSQAGSGPSASVGTDRGSDSSGAKTVGLPPESSTPSGATGSSVPGNGSQSPTTLSGGAAPNTTSTTSTPGAGSTNVGSTASSGNKTQPAAVGSVSPSDSPGSVALQFRGLLDASTLAEIRRLEVAGSAAGSLPALEHALAALRKRAAQLSEKANTLRHAATTAP